MTAKKIAICLLKLFVPAVNALADTAIFSRVCYFTPYLIFERAGYVAQGYVAQGYVSVTCLA